MGTIAVEARNVLFEMKPVVGLFQIKPEMGHFDSSWKWVLKSSKKLVVSIQVRKEMSRANLRLMVRS